MFPPYFFAHHFFPSLNLPSPSSHFLLSNLICVTLHNTTRHNTTQHNTTRHNTTQHKHDTSHHITSHHISSYLISLHLISSHLIPTNQALNPPMEDRIRDFDESPNLPAPADWRKSLSPRVGGILNPQTQIVRSNHFKGQIICIYKTTLYDNIRVTLSITF